MLIYILFIVVSYLVGSIPFGVVFSKLFGSKDLRSHGSGNIGATNAFRVGGKKLGVLTFACDTLKGALPLFLISYLFPEDVILLAVSGFAAVLGHIFPVWLKFKGGKGVATTLAVLYVFDYMHGLFATAIWIITFAITRKSSISSIVMMVCSSLLAYFYLPIELAFSGLMMAFLVIYRHKENINRILKGEEKSLL